MKIIYKSSEILLLAISSLWLLLILYPHHLMDDITFFLVYIENYFLKHLFLFL